MPWGVADYNTNPALNPAINGIDIAEGSAAAGYNDALRQMMADIAAWTASNGVTYPVSVAHGGTGAITAPAALTALNALPATYSHLILANKSANFSPSDVDSGAAYNCVGTVATITIAPEASIAITSGFAATLRNSQVGSIAVVRGAGVTLEVNGATSSSDATVSPGAIATLIKWGTDFWTITGAGVS